MFKVYLSLHEVSVRGLEALDLRRGLGLPDASSLVVNRNVQPVEEFSSHAVVNEGFARLHFGYKAVCDSEAIELSWLARHEVRVSRVANEEYGFVAVNWGAVTPYRMEALYMKAKYVREVERLRLENHQLKNRLAVALSHAEQLELQGRSAPVPGPVMTVVADGDSEPGTMQHAFDEMWTFVEHMGTLAQGDVYDIRSEMLRDKAVAAYHAATGGE